MGKEFDVIVVGAGPAGAAAAYKAAQEGLSVLLLDQGQYPGAKVTCGGMLYGSSLNALIPNFWQEAPVERPVAAHQIGLLAEGSALRIALDCQDFAEPPYNGFTILRRSFDAWFVAKAQAAGAIYIGETVVDDLLWEGGQVVGVCTRRPDGDIRARVVVAADGALSLLAEKAGLRRPHQVADLGLSVKELLALPKETIDSRFALSGDTGAAHNYIGHFARGIVGGGFVYTNKESVSVGVVVSLESLRDNQITALEILEAFKAEPAVNRLIAGGRMLEYSAHLVPEGGLAMMPKLYTGGMVVAGDAAGMAINKGITLQGLNLAISSGVSAACAALQAHRAGSFGPRDLAVYEDLLQESGVLASMKAHRAAPGLLQTERIYDEYPDLAVKLFKDLLSVPDEHPKRLVNVVRRQLFAQVTLPQLVRDLIMAGKAI